MMEAAEDVLKDKTGEEIANDIANLLSQYDSVSPRINGVFPLVFFTSFGHIAAGQFKCGGGRTLCLNFITLEEILSKKGLTDDQYLTTVIGFGMSMLRILFDNAEFTERVEAKENLVCCYCKDTIENQEVCISPTDHLQNSYHDICFLQNAVKNVFPRFSNATRDLLYRSFFTDDTGYTIPFWNAPRQNQSVTNAIRFRALEPGIYEVGHLAHLPDCSELIPNTPYLIFHSKFRLALEYFFFPLKFKLVKLLGPSKSFLADKFSLFKSKHKRKAEERDKILDELKKLLFLSHTPGVFEAGILMCLYAFEKGDKATFFKYLNPLEMEAKFGALTEAALMGTMRGTIPPSDAIKIMENKAWAKENIHAFVQLFKQLEPFLLE